MEFEKLLRDKIQSMIPESLIVGKVKTVSESNYTCSVMPLDNDAELFKVRLKPTINSVKKGIISIPAVDSFVIVGLLNNKDSKPFIVWCSNFTKHYIFGDGGNSIEFKDDGTLLLNGDTLGGLVKIDNLKTQYDANISAIKTAVIAGFTSVDGALNSIVPGSGVSVVAFNASALAIQNLNKTPLENTKVKHG